MKVVVLMGGPSAEREISLATGRAVVGALRRLGHDVTPIDPAFDGDPTVEGLAARNAAAAGRGETGPSGNDSRAPGEKGGPHRDSPAHARTPGAPPGHLAFMSSSEIRTCDTVFVALHGPAGEDGRVQAALDLAGVRYTGSGALASALSMNKDMSKKIFLSQHIPTPEWLFYSARGRSGGPMKQPVGGTGAHQSNSLRSERETLDPEWKAPDPSDMDSLGGFPVVVKPNDQGSTIGLTIVRDERALPKAFETAARYSREIIVERYIPGRELTVSVLDGEALPVVEIIPQGGLYDYTRKYTKGKSRYVVPAELDAELALHVRELGLKCFNALGCSGFGRVDMRLSPENKVFCLEVNTVPGMTEMSLVPMAAEAVGISFDQLVERILASAIVSDLCQRGEKWA